MEKFIYPPEQDTYVKTPATNVLTEQLDGGASRSRLDKINSSELVGCTWVFNREQYQYFKAFYFSAAKEGAAWFLMDLLMSQPYLEEHEVKFVPGSVVMSEPKGLSFIVSAELEVKPKDDTDYYDAIVVLHGDDDFLNILEQLANYDLEV